MLGNDPHTVTADDSSFDSGEMRSGDRFAVTYDAAGTFGYYCAYHGAPGVAMFGTVIVEADGDDAPSASTSSRGGERGGPLNGPR